MRSALQMKLYSLGGIVGGLLVELYQVACYALGKRAVAFGTRRRVRTEDDAEELAFTWYGLARGDDGQPVLAGLVGFIVLVTIAAVVVWVLNAARQAGG
jgi:hypothetical protein